MSAGYAVMDADTGNAIAYVKTEAEAWHVVDGSREANPDMTDESFWVIQHDGDDVVAFVTRPRATP